VSHPALSALTADDQLVQHAVEVLRPDSEEYDAARQIWNGMVDRRPALILRPKDASGVSACVKFARSVGHAVAVKGGGHSAPGYSMCDDDVVVDLSRMAAVSVDPGARTASVQGGALLGALDRATAPHALVVPAGAISHTGAGGLTLGGGFGHIMRKFGLTIDSLIGAQVVLADGRIVESDATSESELFWALRGGSGNFGIVTEFRFKCHPFGPDVYVSTNVIELENAAPALKLWRTVMSEAPEELAWNAFFRSGPDRPEFDWIPAHLRDVPVLIMPLIWAGDPAEGERYIKQINSRLDAAGTKVATRVSASIPYLEVQQQWDEVFAHGRRHYAKAGFFKEVPDEALQIVLDAVERLPHPATQVEILRLGGAVAKVASDATAFPHRDANWPFNLIGLWDDAADDPIVTGWVRDLYSRLEPFMSPGSYVNYAGGDEVGGTEAAYGKTWERLRELKDVYDPTNVFRYNANLKARS